MSICTHSLTQDRVQVGGEGYKITSSRTTLFKPWQEKKSIHSNENHQEQRMTWLLKWTQRSRYIDCINHGAITGNLKSSILPVLRQIYMIRRVNAKSKTYLTFLTMSCTCLQGRRLHDVQASQYFASIQLKTPMCVGIVKCAYPSEYHYSFSTIFIWYAT